MKSNTSLAVNCPLPIGDFKKVVLAHGGGGKLMHELIDSVFIAAFGGPEPGIAHDGAVVKIASEKIVLTTDSYVVDPLFFPGGDIGTLAINGTVNDLAMCGARPLYLSAGFIIEEGFSIECLRMIAHSMRSAAGRAKVQIVTGDTKVVDRGKGHGVFINTAGVGVLDHNLSICPGSIRPGDVIILNGDVGRHGVAVMAEREGLAFETEIESDCAPLAETVMRLIDAGIEIHCLRDLTRGGLATAMVELASASGDHLQIEESRIPVCEDVRGACEILGLDPHYIANEGRFVVFLPECDHAKALGILVKDPSSPSPAVIGSVTEAKTGLVTMQSVVGTERRVEMLSGDQLPRIC